MDTLLGLMKMMIIILFNCQMEMPIDLIKKKLKNH